MTKPQLKMGCRDFCDLANSFKCCLKCHDHKKYNCAEHGACTALSASNRYCSLLWDCETNTIEECGLRLPTPSLANIKLIIDTIPLKVLKNFLKDLKSRNICIYSIVCDVIKKWKGKKDRPCKVCPFNFSKNSARCMVISYVQYVRPSLEENGAAFAKKIVSNSIKKRSKK